MPLQLQDLFSCALWRHKSSPVPETHPPSLHESIPAAGLSPAGPALYNTDHAETVLPDGKAAAGVPPSGYAAGYIDAACAAWRYGKHSSFSQQHSFPSASDGQAADLPLLSLPQAHTPLFPPQPGHACWHRNSAGHSLQRYLPAWHPRISAYC